MSASTELYGQTEDPGSALAESLTACIVQESLNIRAIGQRWRRLSNYLALWVGLQCVASESDFGLRTYERVSDQE